MITVEVFDDGSAIKTWSHRSGKCNTYSMMSSEEVQTELKSACVNKPEGDGCGICLTCSVKAGWQVWKDEQIRNAAREIIEGEVIDRHDLIIHDFAEVEHVDGGAWVDARIWVPSGE